jgi:GGDEF domain-containing protein
VGVSSRSDLLQVWNRKTLKALIVPGGILLMGAALVTHTGAVTLAPPALRFLYYCALIGGALLTWRFHSSRIFFALLVLFLAYQGIALSQGGQVSAPGARDWTVFSAVSVLMPVNFLLIAFMRERGFGVSGIAPFGTLLFMQAVVLAVLERARASSGLTPAPEPAANASISTYGFLAFTIAAILLAGRTIVTRKPSDHALFWALVSFFLSIYFNNSVQFSYLYSAVGACILAMSIVETSYLLAYHDELTALPSRRAFNDALDRLQQTFSIAVVDIDHFKQFNDTYGHDTGDQVLRLVASRLASVTGGGQAYRCGGEEFAILFPGKTVSDVVEHLEGLRATIETAEFRMRGFDRRQTPRGPDRRNQRNRRRTGKRQAVRQPAEEKKIPASLSVTVSIGVAGSSPDDQFPDTILQAADTALYRAKGNGRNRVETISPPKRSPRAKAAGIA